MWRNIFGLIFAALWFVGSFGGRFLASSEKGRESAASFLESIDAWLLREAYSPTLIIIGLGGLFGIFVAMPLARHAREHWFGATRREFLNQFRSVEQTLARRDFRWNLERAYRKHAPNAKRGELADGLRRLNWPTNFPPTVDVAGYAENIDWPDDNSKRLWEFMDALFCDVYDISKRIEKLEREYYHSMLIGHHIAAKFWTYWAHQMRDGLLNPMAVKDALDANEPDIKAIVLAELALHNAVGCDPAPEWYSLIR